ncbi:MAG: hypothetical protein E5W64_19295, partial [Mesorhizobium sp.]
LQGNRLAFAAISFAGRACVDRHIALAVVGRAGLRSAPRRFASVSWITRSRFMKSSLEATLLASIRTIPDYPR